MKIQVLQENLSKALTLASRFASVRAQLPVLGNILLTGKKTKLLVSSTNLEASVVISVGAQVKKEGEITIPARTITEIITNLPFGTLSLEAEKEQLKISSEKFTSTLAGMNSADFPEIPQSADKKTAMELPKDEFAKALAQVVYATSIDETRPILTGVLFIIQKNSLTLVATDGFRLSQKKLNLTKAGKLQKVILPKTVLLEMMRLTEKEDDITFSLKEKENQAVFKTSDVILSSRTLQGEFPSFEKIIPKNSIYKITLDKEEMFRAVKLSSVFARDSANIVKIRLRKDLIEVFAESSQSGSQKTKVDAKIETDEKIEGFEIAFNYRFLEEFLHTVHGEEVKMEFSNANAPGIFLDTKDKDYLHLIMPVRIKE